MKFRLHTILFEFDIGYLFKMKLIYLLLFICLQAWIANGRCLQEEEDSFSTEESELTEDIIKALEESIYGHRNITEQKYRGNCHWTCEAEKGHSKNT